MPDSIGTGAGFPFTIRPSSDISVSLPFFGSGVYNTCSASHGIILPDRIRIQTISAPQALQVPVLITPFTDFLLKPLSASS